MDEDKRVLLQGTPASVGTAKGKVKIVLGPEDSGKMKDGDILIARMTNPQLTPAILKASAIVTEIGGILSHAAIVARELGIPCVLGVEGAITALKDGDEVIVDGTAGYIYKAN